MHCLFIAYDDYKSRYCMLGLINGKGEVRRIIGRNFDVF